MAKDISEEDLNVKAFKKDRESGKFKNLRPGTFVAYSKGKYLFRGFSRRSFFKRASMVPGQCFYMQVNIPEKVLHFRSHHFSRSRRKK